MEQEHVSSLAVTHLLQHTLRSLCLHENSQWVYAVFWRILPRNYPPPKWDTQGGAYDRSRANRRNWILVWEDGFCNFGGASAEKLNSGEGADAGVPAVYGSCDFQCFQGLQPELFFKMTHEIYNYGEGLIGKVAADHSHKWVHKERNEQEINMMSAWHNSADSHPRTWEAQFQSGIKTIALIAVREGVVQLGAVNKVVEDLSDIVLMRKKLSYIESIPGVLLPHPSSSAFPCKIVPEVHCNNTRDPSWPYQAAHNNIAHPDQFYDHFSQPLAKITPSMSSLEALLSKLPSVVPPPQPMYGYSQLPIELLGLDDHNVMKEEANDQEYNNRSHEADHHDQMGGESSASMAAYRPYYIHHQAI